MTSFYNTFSEEVWKTTYKHHADNTVDDTIRRQAKCFASIEENPEHWEEVFYNALSNFKVVPGGRIIANAGTEWKGTTFFNCFTGYIPDYNLDSIEGIYKTLYAQAQTLKSEGGWGLNFSFIRPRGSFIEGIGVESPGAVAFMELFDKSSEIITSGSGLKSNNSKAKGKIRKGAQMSILNDWHPDVLEFVTAKQTPGRLTKFNMSVNFSNKFMDRLIKIKELQQNPELNKLEIEELDKWDLVFPETTHPDFKEVWNGDLEYWESLGLPIKVYNTVSVQGLWNLVMTSTYNRAEPGVVFADQANSDHLLNYIPNKYKIGSTNPCFQGDTLIAVADGRNAVPIKQLVEEGKDVPVYSINISTGEVEIQWARNPRKTRENQELIKVTLDDESFLIVTPDHTFINNNKKEIKAKDLIPGMSLPKFYKKISKIHTKDSKDYYKIKSNVFDYKEKFEHRLICEFFNKEKWNKLYDLNKQSGWIKGGIVVHHVDHNGLNNSPENLIPMTFREHSEIHDLIDVSGEKNPMFGKEHSEETKQKIGAKSLERWQTTEFREKVSNAMKESWTEENKSKFSKNVVDRYVNIHLEEAKKTNLNAFIGEDGKVWVNKVCEITKLPFQVPWNKRDRLWHPSVHVMQIEEYKQKVRESNNKNYQENARVNLQKQVKLFIELSENLNRIPFKTEFETICKENNISCRFNPHTNNPYILKSYDALKKYVTEYNHKVKSIEYLDYKEDVYNLTVEHNQNVGIITKVSGTTFDGIYTMQCAEQFMPNAAACCIGVVNLTQFVDIKNRVFDYSGIYQHARVLARILDNVNTISDAPEWYLDAIRNRRRIGCGVMGWGSALYMLQVRFGSEEASKIQEELMKAFTSGVLDESTELARLRGSFKECDNEKIAEHSFLERIGITEEQKSKIKKHGIRNSALFSLQPNGNSSVLCNLITGGGEPLFGHGYIRTVIVPECPENLREHCPKYWEKQFHETPIFKLTKEGDEEILRGVFEGVVYKIDKSRGLTKEVWCEDYSISKLKELNLWDPQADWAVTAQDLTVEEHVRDLKGFCKYLDSSMSKTVNLPNEYSLEDFEDVYLDAYKSGIKGITTYRSGTMLSVLSTKTSEDISLKRPENLPCDIYRITRDKEIWYIFIGLKEGKPYEIFAGTSQQDIIPSKLKTGIIKKIKHGKVKPATYNLICEDFTIEDIVGSFSGELFGIQTRLISALLRNEVDIEQITKQLQKDPTPSLYTFFRVVSRVLKKYITDGTVSKQVCSECSGELIFQEGCFVCKNCGYSKCN